MQITEKEEEQVIKRVRYVENQRTRFILKKMGFETKEIEFFTLELGDLENGIISYDEKRRMFWADKKINFEDLTDIEIINWKEINELEYEIELRYAKYIVNRYNQEYVKKYITQDCKLTLKQPILN